MFAVLFQFIRNGNLGRNRVLQIEVFNFFKLFCDIFHTISQSHSFVCVDIIKIFNLYLYLHKVKFVLRNYVHNKSRFYNT